MALGTFLFIDSNDLDSAGVFAKLVILVIMSLLIKRRLDQGDQLARKRLGLEAPTIKMSALV